MASSLALLAVTGIGPASAIVIRHDREDRRHVELAAAYPEVVHLELETPTGPPDCEGTLVAPRWVATAAHAAVEVAPGHRVSVHGVAATVESIFIHPAWEDGPHDLALLHLAASVPGVEPARLYREHDEVGQVVTVVGRGDTGDGRSGPVRNDGLTRAATNRIDSASELWLKFAFDQGEAATELEGISGPGDSGGPAFVDRGGVRYLLGVGSGQSTRATGGREGLYGVTEYYTRISTHVDWLDSTMRRADERPAGTESAPVAQLSRAGATARAGGAER